ncbi:ABC transporter permease subunit [Halosimplex rubrum]|uniref:ABC transporter permease subunit n=1 Tax=Halosimplex rubrum TaxID=869889 RepID=A0A7D5P2C6_9EURY|nr:ABC transporter permease subunit [Halosimplex rubrum]QLH78997.1 ABC transporter permease subunit [Halosimplex rubrum]
MSEESKVGNRPATDGSSPAAAVGGDAGDRTVRDRLRALRAVAQRAFDTVVRTRAYLALAAVYGLVVVALPLAGGVGGYLPLVLDLSTPVEVLVPLVAFGFGTWSVLADAASGELDAIRTFPVDRSTYVLGTFLGRAVGLLAAVLAPLLLLAVSVPIVREPSTAVFVSHATVDSPVYLARFVALTAAYALVALALAMAVSSLARSRRAAVAAAAVVALAAVVGVDALVILGLAEGFVGADALGVALGLSPTGAFRGLVLSTATGGVVSTGPPAANVAASVVGLAGWLAVGLAVATLGAWSSGGR